MNPGTYRHFKGGRYRFLHCDAPFLGPEDIEGKIDYIELMPARHADDKRVVSVCVDTDSGVLFVLDPMGPPGTANVYLSLDHGTMWVRDADECESVVQWTDGVARQRFVREDFGG